MSTLTTLAFDAAAYVRRLAYRAGVHAARLGQPREVPQGAPATGHEAFLAGWDAETRRLSVVTGEA
jgi:hypothetical protein